MKQPMAALTLEGVEEQRPRQPDTPQTSSTPKPKNTKTPRWVSLVRLMDGGLCRVERLMMVGVGGLTFALMLLVSLDAILRYSINRPLPFTMDISILYLLPGLLFLALSHTLRNGGHICVDVFALMMPRRVHQTIIGLALGVATAMIAIMAWQTALTTHESWDLNLFASGQYPWPIWFSEALVAFSSTVLMLRLAQMSLANLLAGITGVEGVAVSVLTDHSHAEEEGI